MTPRIHNAFLALEKRSKRLLVLLQVELEFRGRRAPPVPVPFCKTVNLLRI